MFEKQKWSKNLKQIAEDFLNILIADGNEISNEDFCRLVILIDMAMEEGFEDAQDNVKDWYDGSDREPIRDESRD